ncbi:MAG: chlorophyll a/b binding light-harvesting protein [Cyanobacteria bacterium P01_D01_bin.6]
MTLSIEKTFVANNPKSDWLIGNARLVSFSGLLLGAHLAHAALIMLWAGSFTLIEISQLQPGIPLGEQSLSLLPHLALLGWGIGDGGIVVDTYPYLVVGVLHLVSSGVLAAGGLFHILRGPERLENNKTTRKFGYTWDDDRQLTLILGHHLLFLGAGALGLYLKATRWGGLYDGQLHTVRIVDSPTFDPTRIFGYLAGQTPDGFSGLGLAAANNLEDIVGGHLWIAILLILGGIWHIVTPGMLPAFKRIVRVEGEALLSYSLGGVAFMAFLSSVYVSANTAAYPLDLFGAGRSASVFAQILLGTVALAGHIWHAYRVLTGAGLKANPAAVGPGFVFNPATAPPVKKPKAKPAAKQDKAPKASSDTAPVEAAAGKAEAEETSKEAEETSKEAEDASKEAEDVAKEAEDVAKEGDAENTEP